MKEKRVNKKNIDQRQKQRQLERQKDRRTEEKENVKIKLGLIVTGKQCDGVIIFKDVCFGQNFHILSTFCPCQLLQNQLSRVDTISANISIEKKTKYV